MYHIISSTHRVELCTAASREACSAPALAVEQEVLHFIAPEVAHFYLKRLRELGVTHGALEVRRRAGMESPYLHPIPAEDWSVLKRSEARRPSHGMPCVNPSCSTAFHDLRTDAFVKCLEQMKGALSPKTFDLLLKVHSSLALAYRSGAYANRLQELAREFVHAPFWSGARPRQREALERMSALAYLIHLEGEPTMEVFGEKYSADLQGKLAQNFQRLPKGDRLPAEREAFRRLKEAGVAWEAHLNSYSTGGEASETEPAAPLTPSAYGEMELMAFVALLEREKTASEAPRVEEVVRRRWWGHREVTVVTLPPEPTEAYRAMGEFVNSLPFRSREIFLLARSVASQPKLSTPEVRERLNREFKKTYEEEMLLTARETEPLELVEAMLSTIHTAGAKPAVEAPQ